LLVAAVLALGGAAVLLVRQMVLRRDANLAV